MDLPSYFLEVWLLITIDLGVLEYYDSSENRFITETGGVVRFEYSLKVMYEWEGKWKKSFLKRDFTDEELLDFYKRMALDDFDDKFLTYDVIEMLRNYINDNQTATVFASSTETSSSKSNSGKLYTAEELYANMIMAGIPLEFENRNLNRLLTILRIISIKNEPPKKMAKADILKQNASLNEQRKAMYNTKG